jgi:DNA-binding MarR family transcriptional regulator
MTPSDAPRDPVATDPVSDNDRVRKAVREFVPEADVEALIMCFNLVRISDRLQQDVETSVHRPAGLTFAAFRLMLAIRTAGPQTPLVLSRLTNVTQGTVSSGLKNLERHGLVRREPSPVDGRSVTVHLTDAGEDVLAELVRHTNEREVLWASVLSDDEREILVSLLRKLRSYDPPPAEPMPRLIGESAAVS